jgi:hypothetical protein
MTPEQIYNVISQALDMATQKGAYNLQDVRSITDALLALQKELDLNSKQTEEVSK